MADDYPLKRHLMTKCTVRHTLIECTLLLDYVFLWFVFLYLDYVQTLKELGCFKLDDLKEMFCTMKLLVCYHHAMNLLSPS